MPFVFAAYGAAMFSKEMALTLPLLIVAHDWLLADPWFRGKVDAAKAGAKADAPKGDARTDTPKAEAKADADQRDVVTKNRGEVAKQQKAGIKQAYDQVNEFNASADTEQSTARKEVGAKVKGAETEARDELKQGEADAEKKKEEGEKEAAAKKQ